MNMLLQMIDSDCTLNMKLMKKERKDGTIGIIDKINYKNIVHEKSLKKY